MAPIFARRNATTATPALHPLEATGDQAICWCRNHLAKCAFPFKDGGNEVTHPLKGVT